MKRTHGESETKLYGLWSTMKARCYNPNMTNYRHYGGRGISVCDEWRNSYVAFKEWAMSHGYKYGLTIDRIDNNGNYEPDNCRWVTRGEQCKNTRKNRFFTLNGETHCLSEWEEKLNISHSVLWKRLDKGIPFEEAIKIPVSEAHSERNITFDGETHNISEWSKIFGVKDSLIRERLKSGNYTVEQALTEPPNSRLKHDLQIEYKGETKHLKEWAKEINIPYWTLRKRIFELGYSVERAFTQPVKKMRKKSKRRF